MDASARELSARIRRNAVLIAGGQALTSVIVQINSVIAALVIYGLTKDAILAGGVSAIIYAGGIPASYLSGWLMDRFGRRPVLVLGGGLTGLSMIGLAIFYLFASVTGMITMFLLFGVGRAILNQNRVAIADMFPSSSLGRAFGYLYTASVVGAILTVPLVGVIEPYSQSLGVKSSALLWITSAALGCVVATLIAAVRPDPRR